MLQIFAHTLRARGFGAIELIIVIIVLGAIMVLTLKGTQLIAPMRAFVIAQQLDRYQASVLQYQADIRALPGDDPGGASRWSQREDALFMLGNAPVSYAGDNKLNGLLDDSGNAAGEQYMAWSDLRAGGYLPGDPKLTGQSARPENTYGGVYGFAEDNLGLQQVLCMTRVPGRDAEILDTRLDDGKIATGRLRGTSQWDPVEAKNHFAAPDSAPYDPEKTYIICLPMLP